ncbi:hypothetical protein LTR08_001042 [Meristemomyces frigidus]|nr:hypothetical protein LTR08_001042 [Meristemomyces frigidus]
MDHRQRAEHYRKQVVEKQKLLDEAEERVFELEGAVADRDVQLKQQAGGKPQLGATQQRRVEELERQLAAASDQQKENTHMKMEDDEPSLQQQIKNWSAWLGELEDSTGLAAAEIADTVKVLREKLSNEQGVSKARATTITNYESRLRSKDEKLANKQKTLENAQNEVQKLKARLFRETLSKPATTANSSPSAANDSPEVPGSASRASVSTPKELMSTPKRKASKMHGSENYRDEDDEENNVPKPTKTAWNSVGQRTPVMGGRRIRAEATRRT